MPAFMYTVIILNALVWWAWFTIIDNTRPESFANIALFLLVTLVAITLTLSLPIYFYLYKKSPSLTRLRGVYRKSFKNSFVITLGIISFMALKIFGLLNAINVLLLIILYISVLWVVFRK